MKREEYLKILTDQIRCRMTHDAVKAEYCAHIEDQMQAYMSNGMEKKRLRKQRCVRWAILWRQAMSWTEYIGRSCHGE